MESENNSVSKNFCLQIRKLWFWDPFGILIYSMIYVNITGEMIINDFSYIMRSLKFLLERQSNQKMGKVPKMFL